MITKQINGISFITSQWPFREDGPTVVFIHGAGSSSLFWQAQVRGLADVVNTVAVDLPGHGQSAGSGMSAIDGYAATVAEFIASNRVPAPILCGHSMGGAITLQLLLDNQERYRGGIVINSGAKLKVAPAILEMIQDDYHGYTVSLGKFAVAARTDQAIVKAIITAAEECAPEVTFNDFIACNGFDVIARLDEIRVPILVLTAEEDQLSPVKYGEFLAERIDQARRIHIAHAGHLLPVEKPDEINKAIIEFVHSIPDIFHP